MLGAILRLFGFPPFEVGASTLAKKINKLDSFGLAILALPIAVAVAFVKLDKSLSGSWIFAILFVIAFMLLILLFLYDFVAVECYKNKNSEYFRASGITRNDLVGPSDKAKGARGEFAAYVLSNKCKVPHKMLYNVCVPMPNGNYQEIDALMITDRGIFSIECKNRGGVFTGYGYDWEKWYQNIGNESNEVHNIYLQNQGHIYALDLFLQNQGLIGVAETYFNLILTNGEMEIQVSGDKPEAFAYGDSDDLARIINRFYKRADAIDVDNFVKRVYEALLPYSLIPAGVRESMDNYRRNNKQNHNNGEWQYIYFKDGIPGLIEKPVLYRQNNIYHQISVDGLDWHVVNGLKYKRTV